MIQEIQVLLDTAMEVQLAHLGHEDLQDQRGLQETPSHADLGLLDQKDYLEALVQRVVVGHKALLVSKVHLRSKIDLWHTSSDHERPVRTESWRHRLP